MSNLSSRLCRLALASTLILGFNAGVRPPAAQASFDQTIAPYPDDTMALVTISLNPANWGFLISKLSQKGNITVKTTPSSDSTSEPDSAAESSADSGQAEMPEEVKELIKFLQNDLKFDPFWDGLANLGSHLTLAYRPWPGTQGQLLFSLNLRSADRVDGLMSRFYERVQAEGEFKQVVKQKFGPYDIYTLRVSDDETSDSDATDEKSDASEEVSTNDGQAGSASTRLAQSNGDEEEDEDYDEETDEESDDESDDQSDEDESDDQSDEDESEDDESDESEDDEYEDDESDDSSEDDESDDTSEDESDEESEDEGPEFSLDDFKEIHLAVSGNNLIGAVGNNDALLKRMLYTQQVLPKDSNFRLANNQLFKPIRESLEDKTVWAYFDVKHALEAANMFSKDQDAPEEMAMLGQLTNLFRGFGFGVDIEPEGVSFKSFVSPDWQNLTPKQREYIEAMSQKPQHELTALMEYMPADPILLTAGQNLDVALKTPLPVDLPELPFTEDDIRQGIIKVLNVDYKEDFLPHIDGRYGFGVYPGAKEDDAVQAVLYLGLRDGHEAAFDQVMQTRFRFDPEALDSLGGEGKDVSSVQQNMKTLQTIVETHGVDWGGLYPASLSALKSEAEVEGREYWKDVKNPISGKSGMGEAIQDYEGMGERPDSKLAGKVFYEPTGEKSQSDGHTFYTGYNIYGYDPSGKLYKIDQNGEDFETVLDILPQVEVPPQAEPGPSVKFIEDYQGARIYALDVALPFDDMPTEAIKDIQPVFARKGQVWMLAMSPAALKAALSGQGHPDRLAHMVDQTSSRKAQGLFFMDIQAGVKMANTLLNEGKSDPTIQAAIAPWRSLFGSSLQREKGTEGHFVVDADLNKLDFDAIGKIFDDDASSEESVDETLEVSRNDETALPESAQGHPLKGNLFHSQTMVEIYAIDHNALYPKNVAELIEDARMNEYWRGLKNPFTESEEYTDTLADYADFKPGNNLAGKVLYKPELDEDGQVRRYSFFAVDENGELFKLEGKVVENTNYNF